MKKTGLLLVLLLTLSIFSYAQKSKTEVLYFKAPLSCCQATACNALESDIKSIIEKNYKDGKVVFKVVKTNDQNNKQIVEKYKAKSQTVVIEKTKRKKTKSIDVSDIVRKYTRSKDKVALEKDLIDAINNII
jgi:hypothetical protein